MTPGTDMTTDIRLAFAHPEERAAASASSDPRDRISLRDHVVEVLSGTDHRPSASERSVPRRERPTSEAVTARLRVRNT